MQCASSITKSEIRTAIPASTCVRKRSFASRSGEINRMSISPLASLASTAAQSSMLSELIVAARTPIRSAAAIWLRISASSGEINNAGPAPASRSNLVAMK
jgi:hypothetical protein